jgi:hypothetical protein
VTKKVSTLTQMCHDFATKFLSIFIKIEKCCKSKKPANPRICRFYHIFYGFLKSLIKLPFSLLLPFCGESRIRTCEVHTADLQSALVGRLSISPISALMRFVVLSGCKYINVFDVYKLKSHLILSYF